MFFIWVNLSLIPARASHKVENSLAFGYVFCPFCLHPRCKVRYLLLLYTIFLLFIIIVLRFFNIWQMVWFVLLHILTFFFVRSFVRFSFLVVRSLVRLFGYYLFVACLVVALLPYCLIALLGCWLSVVGLLVTHIYIY